MIIDTFIMQECPYMSRKYIIHVWVLSYLCGHVLTCNRNFNDMLAFQHLMRASFHLNFRNFWVQRAFIYYHEMNLLRYVLGSSSRPKPSLSTYDGNLLAEGLIDWIGDLDRYFDYEEIEEDKKVKLVVTRLKGHAALWWDSVQAKRKNNNKSVIKSWDRMIANM